MKPIIGIISNATKEDRGVFKTNATYIKRIKESGGLPFIIPSNIDLEDCKQIIQQIDGLLIPGGGDIVPELFGEETHPLVVSARRADDLFEIKLVELAKEYSKPIIGICRGAQIINVAFGGTLYQDIPSQYKNEICHRQSEYNRDEPIHKVYLEENSYIMKILGKSTIGVNSFHHQSVKDIGEGLNVAGRAADGVIEAIESENGMIIGLQWHPERLTTKYEEFKDLFVYFIKKCNESKQTSKN